MWGTAEQPWKTTGDGFVLVPSSVSTFYSSAGLIHCKDWCWSSNTLATWCEEPTHWKKPCCWERLKAEEGDYRGWDSWTASLTQWTWVWASPGSWWWTWKPGVLHSTGSQRVRHEWATELNWTELNWYTCPPTLEPPCRLPPHPTPLGCHRAPDLSSLYHTANSHGLSIFHMVMYIFQCYSLIHQ